MWPFTDSYPTCTPSQLDEAEFDYIVVGGGTGGSVVASRLSEDPHARVLLVERGPLIDAWASHVPLLSADFNRPAAPVYRWRSEPGTALRPGGIEMITGKALGGTSKVNASIYQRGMPAEYDAWAAAGREGWGWEDVRPFFEKSERSISFKEREGRGSNGPWANQSVSPVLWDFTNCSIAASAALGFPSCESVNDARAPAVSCVRTESTIDERGRRLSMFDSFLPPSLVRARAANLKLCPRTIVSSLIFESSAGGLRAAGVVLDDDDDDELAKMPRPSRRVYARRETILCGGTIATPHVLLLSGVGPAEDLREQGVKVQLNHPNVGKGLQDHLGVPVIWHTPLKGSIHKLLKNMWLLLRELARYLLFTRGLFLMQTAQVLIFARSALLDESSATQHTSADLDGRLPQNLPDIEIMPMAVAATNRREVQALVTKGAASALCVLLRPGSRGVVALASTDPRARPRCTFNALSDPADMAIMKKAVRLGQAVGRRIGESSFPLGDVLIGTDDTDADLERHIRENIGSTYHYTSSCRMAPLAEGGVVDDRLRVHGIDGLRIADASVFPAVPSSHTQAPTVMIAERCAAFIRADGKGQ